MPNPFKEDLRALVVEAMNSDDLETKKLAVAMDSLLVISNFGPDVFDAFYKMLLERTQAFEKVAGAMRVAAEQMQR